MSERPGPTPPAEGFVLQIKKIGNSTGLILPKEMMARLNIGDGRYVLCHHNAGRRNSADALRSEFRAGDEGRAPRHESLPQRACRTCEVIRRIGWLSLPLVLAIHDEQLVAHGGSGGVRDIALLEFALNRPLNKRNYENAELPELAAAYAYGIGRNHPFVDGNKRTSLLALYTFLGINGVDFIVAEADAAVIILSLASGEVSEESLARWIRDNWPEGGVATPPHLRS